MTTRTALALLAAALMFLGACSGGGSTAAPARKPPRRRAVATTAVDPTDVYAHIGAQDVAPVAAKALPRVYVPNSESATVDVIDPSTFKVVDHFRVGRLPQHVTPAWDLKTLYVDNDEGNSLTPIDPVTGRAGTPVAVEDPYNLYFTPDGTHALVVAERLHRIDFRDPTTWKVDASVRVPCRGVDHADFSADGTTMFASCEFSGDLVRIDLKTHAVTGTLHVGGQPIDVKLGPDATVLYVANQSRNGVSIIDVASFTEKRFVRTGAGAHGLYPSRDVKSLYVTNRKAGSVSVLDFRTGAVQATWKVGGSPDMGGVTADGSQLWLSGRYDAVVYVIDTSTGAVLHKIGVGKGPHGLCVWPQPGRYSLGHTGILR